MYSWELAKTGRTGVINIMIMLYNPELGAEKRQAVSLAYCHVQLGAENRQGRGVLVL